MLGHLLVQMASKPIHVDPMVLQMQWGVFSIGKPAAGGMSSYDQTLWKIDCLPNCLVYLGCVIMRDGLFWFSNLVLDNHNNIGVINLFSKPQQLVMSNLTVTTLSSNNQIDLEHNNFCKQGYWETIAVSLYWCCILQKDFYLWLNWFNVFWMKMLLFFLLTSVLLSFGAVGSVLISQFSQVLLCVLGNCYFLCIRTTVNII